MTFKDYLKLIFSSPVFWAALVALLNAVGSVATTQYPQWTPVVTAFNAFVVAVGTILCGVQVGAARATKQIAAKFHLDL